MQLMRNQLKQIFSRVNDAHAGLLMQRGLTDWEDEDEKKRLREQKLPTKKEQLVETITNIKASDLYVLAFNRWLDATHQDGNETFATVTAKVVGRLLTGLSLAGTLETGATTHHTYGMPMLAGSSVKGAVRSYTEQLFAERDENGAILFDEADGTPRIVIAADKQTILNTLFGADAGDDSDDSSGSDDSQGNAGYLIWHDAWWIPMVDNRGSLLTAHKPFVADVVTVHHPEYYKGDKGKLDEALDVESPLPNQQIAIQGSFYFVIQGEQKWVHFARELLKETIANVGLGSKGASGYGYFALDDTLSNEIAKRYGKGVAIDTSDDPLAAIRQGVKYLDETQLIDGLSSKKNKFFESLSLDKDNNEDIQSIAQVVLDEHSDLVASWANIDAKNTKKAYKFIQDNIPK